MGSVKDTIDIEYLNAGYRYALSLASNPQDAEDIVHDAWIRLNRRYGKCADKPLLFRTIRNLYIDQYRRRHRLHFSEFDETHTIAMYPECRESEYETAYMEAEQMQIQLDRLRDVEREALFLAVVEGYTADEVARMTASSRGTVLSLIHRAKAKLRQWLAPECEVETAGVVSSDHVPEKMVEAGDNGMSSVSADDKVNTDSTVVDLLAGRNP